MKKRNLMLLSAIAAASILMTGCDENKNFATAGFITGIIGVVLSGILLVCVICAAGTLASAGILS